MDIDFIEVLYTIAVAFIPVMLGIILHEVAHGWAALKMGDPTAKLAGRLTFNPVRHLDPLGTAFFVLTAVSSTISGFPFILGWAKPVPVNFARLHHDRLGVFFVSIAGVLANLCLIIVFIILLRTLLFFGFNPLIKVGYLYGSPLFDICILGIWVNSILICFNLLPIPPLDGSKVLSCFLPAKLANIYLSIGRYGMLVIMALLATGVFSKILSPVLLKLIKIFFKFANYPLP